MFLDTENVREGLHFVVLRQMIVRLLDKLIKLQRRSRNIELLIKLLNLLLLAPNNLLHEIEQRLLMPLFHAIPLFERLADVLSTVLSVQEKVLNLSSVEVGLQLGEIVQDFDAVQHVFWVFWLLDFFLIEERPSVGIELFEKEEEFFENDEFLTVLFLP